MTDPESPEVLAAEEPAPVDDPTTAVREDASDAELRAWAKDNGIEDVPTSGRLSSAWRETIINAMAAALAADPKEEVSAETTSTDSLTPESETVPEETVTTEETTTLSADGEVSSLSTEEPEAEVEAAPVETEPEATVDEEPEVEEEKKPVAPEFETGTYRSVFKAPNTFVSSQAYTA